MILQSNQPEHLKVELGTWYSPIVQKTGANVEACYLVLKHLFELVPEELSGSVMC